MEIADVVARLAGRKGATEADIQSDVRALLLYGGLDLEEKDLDLLVLEAQVGGGRRIDIEVGSTAIEVKKDLSSGDVRQKAVGQLAGYLKSRGEQTGQRYAGILTDGVEWELLYLSSGGISPVSTLRLRQDASDTEALSVWLEGVLATAQGIVPTTSEIHRRLGAESSSFALDYADLRAIYQEHKDDKEVALKRELWARLLASALGTHFPDTDELFVLHTYLVISAELIAHTAVGLPILGQTPIALLSGEVFRAAQLGGVVEADFFDWPAESDVGKRFVQSLTRRIARFDWSSVDHDVLKALYESVIDTNTRKQLGEYYTPDWLAQGMVEDRVNKPLEQHVLDPACGSGTFLFWAARRYLAAAEQAGLSNVDAINGLVTHVSGIDLHPVAVALARVTYLLAIGSERLQKDRPPFSVPVYLGDSVRWGQDEDLFAQGGITIFTTDGAELFDRELHFPERVVADAGRFDQLVGELADRASNRKPNSAVPKLDAVFNRLAVHPDDREVVQSAFKVFCDLHDEGRNHIWGYYVRNLARPLWFTQPANRADVLVGNPPWLAYRFMPKSMQESYKRMSKQRGLWAGGKVSTHQDLSDLFVVRSVEQFLKQGGTFGFVMPASTLSRRQFEGFRGGYYEGLGATTAISFLHPWDLRAVAPDIFPVPSCAVFGVRKSKASELPTAVRAFSGRIAPKGTTWADAKRDLKIKDAAIERGSDEGVMSPYAERFYQGATILPSVLLRVTEVPAGPLGAPKGTRRVASLRSNLEKEPWKSLDSLEDLIEGQFVHPVYLGSGIAPYRTLSTIEAVIPWSKGRLLDADDPGLDEYPNLAKWWRQAEDSWEKHKGDTNKLTLPERLDYHGGLSNQLPIQPQRILYTQSGNRISACRIDDPRAVIEHKLYWAAVSSVDEGLYLEAILNSDELHRKVEPLMSEGLFGKRDVDKYVFAVPFPIFDSSSSLHAEIVAKARSAEEAAADIDLGDVQSVTRARRSIRELLKKKGIWHELEGGVVKLLDSVM